MSGMSASHCHVNSSRSSDTARQSELCMPKIDSSAEGDDWAGCSPAAVTDSRATRMAGSLRKAATAACLSLTWVAPSMRTYLQLHTLTHPSCAGDAWQQCSEPTGPGQQPGAQWGACGAQKGTAAGHSQIWWRATHLAPLQPGVPPSSASASLFMTVLHAQC